MMGKLATFSCAVVLATLLCFYLLPHTWTLPLGAALALVLLPVHRLFAKWKRPYQFLWGFCLGLCWFGIYTMFFYAPATQMAHQTLRLSCVVLDAPQETKFGYAVLTNASEEHGRPVHTILYLDSSFAEVKPGDRISCIAYCTPTNEVKGEETLYYTSRGIYLFAKPYGEITHTVPKKPPLRALPGLAAQKLLAMIDKLYPSEQESAFLKALVIGQKAELDPILTTAFMRVGLGHVVVVSGLHISFLAGVLLLLGGKKKRSAALILGVIFFFTAMTGNGPGTIRAAILCSFGLLAPFFHRRSDPITALTAALLLLILANPYSIGSAGLQLSFAATLGILLFGQPLFRRWRKLLPKRGRRILEPLVSVAAVSLGAMILTLPLSALYFSRISLIAPVANLFTAWSVSLCFLGGLVSLALGFIFFPLGQFAAFLVGFPIRYFVNCTLFFNQLNFAELTLDSFYYRLWLVFLYFILFLVWKERRKRPIIPICACIMTLCLAITLNSTHKGGFQLTVLDVGQGQSIAVGTRDFSALIDCGGAKTAGDTAARFWQSRGIGTLDLLILTHLHADHADGVPELLSRLTVGTIFMPDTDPDNPLRLEIEGLAADQNIPIQYIRTRARFSIGETLFHIEAMVGDGSMNEEGLVILTTYQDKSTLITGDLPTEGEIAFLKRVHVPQLSLLVAGHHGSRYASGEVLIAETKPYYTAISVGYNHYGHPSEETLARLKNSKIYRTDQSGAITFRVGE